MRRMAMGLWYEIVLHTLVRGWIVHPVPRFWMAARSGVVREVVRAVFCALVHVLYPYSPIAVLCL